MKESMRYGTSTGASGEGGAWAAVVGQGGPMVDIGPAEDTGICICDGQGEVGHPHGEAFGDGSATCAGGWAESLQ